jgi:hypothetical protein
MGWLRGPAAGFVVSWLIRDRFQSIQLNPWSGQSSQGNRLCDTTALRSKNLSPDRASSWGTRQILIAGRFPLVEIGRYITRGPSGAINLMPISRRATMKEIPGLDTWRKRDVTPVLVAQVQGLIASACQISIQIRWVWIHPSKWRW